MPMRLEVRLHDADAQQILREYVQRRLAFAVSRFNDRIGTVTFSIRSGSSERRGDFTCKVNVELHPFGAVRAQAAHPDVYSAIDQAVGRVARQCARKIERPRMMRSSRMSIRAA
jgi:ribosomal subunit interface protein